MVLDVFLGLLAFYFAKIFIRFIVGLICERFDIDHVSFLNTFFN